MELTKLVHSNALQAGHISQPHRNLTNLLCRLVPGGLAESTGLLAVNDEVLEVNGIEVAGKSLDQVIVFIF